MKLKFTHKTWYFFLLCAAAASMLNGFAVLGGTTEPSFHNQYVNKQADKFVVSKDGGDGEQIDALSGATITSRAVTGAFNTALGYYQNAFK